MKSKYFYLLHCLLFCFPTYSQQVSLIDSLTRLGDKYKSVEKLNALAWEAQNINSEAALKYALIAKQLATEGNDSLGLSFSLNNIALFYKNKGSYDSSLKYYQQGLNIRLKLNGKLNIGRSYINMLNINKALGNTNEAIKFGLLAESILNEVNAHKEQAKVLNNLGPLYIQTTEYKKALTCYLKSLEIRKNLADSFGVANVYLNLGNYYDIIGNSNKALQYYIKSEQIFEKENAPKQLAKSLNNIGNIYYALNDREKAYTYYIKSKNIKEQLGFDEDVYGTYLNLGLIEESQQNLTQALDYFEKALSGYETINNQPKVSEANLLMGNLHLNKKKYKKATPFLQAALVVAKELNNALLLVDINQSLAQYYKGVKNYDSAFYYLNISNQIKDTLTVEIQKSKEFYTRFLEEQKKTLELENNIAKREADFEKIKTKNKIQNIIGVVLIVMVAFAAILFFLLNNTKKLKLRAIDAKEKEKKSKQKLEELLNKQKERSINDLLEGQETERKRIAQELHDGLGSLLTSVKLYFKSMDSDIDALKVKNHKQFTTLNKLLDEAFDEVRRISNDLVSGVLIDFGLPEALKELCNTIESTGAIQVSLHLHGLENRLDYKLEVNLYRIAQELLTNCLKHSESTEITIQIIRNTKNINLLVEDNGIGFNYDEMLEDKGMGLTNIKKRVNLFEGVLSVDSRISNGTTTSIDINLENI